MKILKKGGGNGGAFLWSPELNGEETHATVIVFRRLNDTAWSSERATVVSAG